MKHFSPSQERPGMKFTKTFCLISVGAVAIVIGHFTAPKNDGTRCQSICRLMFPQQRHAGGQAAGPP